MLPKIYFSDDVYKVILSKPINTNFIKVIVEKNGNKFQASLYTKTQVFHENFLEIELERFVMSHFGVNFAILNAWSKNREYMARVSKKGKVLTTSKENKSALLNKFDGDSFNRKKNHIVNEGMDIPILQDMGIFTKDNKIAISKHDKFHQINRFLELINDETKDIADEINIIDFGCGKSYLTFLVYHFFAVIKNHKVNICGLDLKEDVVNNCKKSAQKYGYKNLEFKLGDIGEQKKPPLENWRQKGTFNIVISLHACDTATDHALFNAIKWEADLICAVPCCQHELRSQMKAKTLKIFDNYGIIQERIASLATDALRAKLLEVNDYRTQIIEFTGLEHTAKNLFIRAKKIKNSKNNKTALINDVNILLDEFSFSPTLYKLLHESNLSS